MLPETALLGRAPTCSSMSQGLADRNHQHVCQAYLYMWAHDERVTCMELFDLARLTESPTPILSLPPLGPGP